MQNSESTSSSLREGIFVFGVLTLTVALVEVLRLPQKWADATVYSAILFGVLVVALRTGWSRTRFWSSVTLAFILHCLFIVPIVYSLPASWQGIPKLYFFPAGLIEGIVLMGAIW